jgi:hypothetical protein
LPRYARDQARCLLIPAASERAASWLHAAEADPVNFLKDQTLEPDVKKWSEVQGRVWSCELCRAHERVACNIRQWTEAPNCSVKLMLIGVAPPYVRGITTKSVAKSATNDDDDNLRKFFVMATLGLSWDALLDRGLFLVHGVKCAIVPKDRHQNPPDDVVDACAPLHLAYRPINILTYTSRGPYGPLHEGRRSHHPVPR